MKKRKRIGLLAPNLQSGGAERVLSNISLNLTKAGYEVYLLLYDTQDICYNYGGKLIDLKGKAGSNFLNKTILRIFRIVKVIYYKKRYKLDIMLSFLYSANIVNYFSFGKTKRILACRGYSDFLHHGKKYAKMITKTDQLIIQTERLKEEFVKKYGVDKLKLSVIYNPFNIKMISEISNEYIDNNTQVFIDSHKTICTVGTFKKDKGFWHLIKAFCLVKKRIPDAGLIFIGHRGEMEKDIIEMARATDYKEDILFLGYQENPFKYIAKCMVYASTSLHEGFPNALIEAMACSTAVISSDCLTGPREILMKANTDKKETEEVQHTDYGVLVVPFTNEVDFDINYVSKEDEMFSKGLIELLSDEKLLNYYEEMGYKRACEFDETNIFIEYVNLIESII